MCGIIGFVDKKETLSVANKEVLVRKMLGRISHRGKDASGVFVREKVAVAHNRLAILDASEYANQPFSIEDKSLTLSYNGEIFNHTELRDKDDHFKTHSDTESLLRAYARQGERVFEIIRGMFAASFYESEVEKITLAVDRSGIKPLYYLNTADWFAWSSEIKALDCLPGVRFELNKDVLHEYGVFRTTAGSQTLIKGINKLLPAEIVNFDIRENKFFKRTYIYSGSNGDTNLEQSLERSVSEALLADFPVGLQLSGGVDSSLIGVMAKKVLRQGKMHSYSIGLKEEGWNEFEYSKAVAGMLGTVHHELTFSQEDFCKNYPIATYHLDEPVAYPNTIPIMLLSREASKDVKVLLSGEGADELFGGYNRYTKIISSGGRYNIPVTYSNSFCSPESVRKLLKEAPSKLEERELIGEEIKGYNLVHKLCAYDMKTFLPSLLLRQDKMGMASTIENRFPFLDPKLVQFAMDLPDSAKNDGCRGKIALKEVALRHLPKSIVYRDKCGFGLPIATWFRDKCGLGRYLSLLTNPIVKRSFFEYENIKKQIAEHIDCEKDNSEAIWILLSLELWCKIFIDHEDPRGIWRSLSQN
jgi:asparagine synthase (glutamine-hydrolysing)